MRYLIHKSQAAEIPARQSYLYDIFYLYFLPGNPEGSFIPLIPVGEEGPGILFITGHNDQVAEHLSSYFRTISEKRIVITSCLGGSFEPWAIKKEVYVPKSASPLCVLRKGEAFGFSFPISDAELNFYNADGDFETKLKTAYELLKGAKNETRLI